MTDFTSAYTESPPTHNGLTVVVAEDEAAIAYMLKVQLEMAGYKVFGAKDGEEAVEEISQNHPHLILMDINMPRMRGFEAIDKLKANGYNFSGTKLIFLTSSSNHADIEKAHAYGADYLIKADMTPKTLLEKIK